MREMILTLIFYSLAPYFCLYIRESIKVPFILKKKSDTRSKGILVILQKNKDKKREPIEK